MAAGAIDCQSFGVFSNSRNKAVRHSTAVMGTGVTWARSRARPTRATPGKASTGASMPAATKPRPRMGNGAIWANASSSTAAATQSAGVSRCRRTKIVKPVTPKATPIRRKYSKMDTGSPCTIWNTTPLTATMAADSMGCSSGNRRCPFSQPAMTHTGRAAAIQTTLCPASFPQNSQ